MRILTFALLLYLSYSKLIMDDGTVLNDRPIIGVFALPSEF